ncbi:hypothetical protein F4778DRAFT_783636 [Xylariomycetidae sp. FL2044]|nr:hypothetical protein F4778DRAFT_783636 [Xylariomycetidae sp. FL2044]
MNLRDAVLGIDLGSTSTRVCMLSQDGRVYYVQNKNRKSSSSRFEAGDFSSSIYPFDGQDRVYLDERADQSRDSISAKYAFYPLVNASDELLEQYPLVDPLMSRGNDPIFRYRLVQGLEELFQRLKLGVDAICEESELKIRTIGLSIPSQWKLDFEDQYRTLVARVFLFNPNDILFVYETNAPAQFLCRDHINLIIKERNIGHHDVLLFLDFGGHNMNACIFNVVYGTDKRPAFYLTEEPEGAGGGSEHWEYLVGKEAERMLETIRGQRISAQTKQSILDQFNRDKVELGPGCGQSFYFRLWEDGKPTLLEVSSERVQTLFGEALRRPLNLAEQKIAQVAKMPSIKARVVVSGGSARHEALQNRLKDICKANGVQPPVFTDALSSLNYDSSKIAQGVAYAVGDLLSVEEFMDRGAAIAIQMQQSDDNPEQLWDDTARILLTKDYQAKPKIRVTGQDRLKLICDPFFAAYSSAKDLHFSKCYDLLELGVPTKGRWSFSLSLKGNKNNMKLVMERYQYQGTKSKLYDKKKFPLYYSTGGSCIFLGSYDMDRQELVAEVTRYPKAPANAARGNSAKPQVAHKRDRKRDRKTGRSPKHAPPRIIRQGVSEHGPSKHASHGNNLDSTDKDWQFVNTGQDLYAASARLALAYKGLNPSKQSPRRVSSRSTKGSHSRDTQL